MEDWTRVVLYGTYDGFTRSTDGLHRIVVILEGGERIEVPKEFVLSADQMVNKNKIKLKDVIARIKSFDVDAREAWLNEILNGLGSDFGSKKYRDGYEQGKLEGLIEREKVEVPQFVADWITKAKTEGLKRKNSLGSYEELFPSDSAYSAMFSIFIKGFAIGEVRNWVAENTDTFALAWINGYTVEKEKRYLVKIKGIRTVNGCLKCDVDDANWFFSGPVECAPYRANHTRKELEEAGFGWVFDCPGMEVEEVTE